MKQNKKEKLNSSFYFLPKTDEGKEEKGKLTKEDEKTYKEIGPKEDN